MSKAKKNRLSIVLALLFALLTIVCLAFLPRGEDSVLAEGSEGVLQVNYKVRKQTLKRGDTFSVELYVPESGNPGIVCLYLSVKNNSAGAFELTGVENKDVFDEKTLGEEVFVCGRLKGDYLDENSTVENSDDPFVISWDASLYGGKENPANVEKTGTLATLTYTVTAESYEIVDTLPITVSLGQGNCYDKDKNLVNVVLAENWEIMTYKIGDINDDGYIDVDDVLYISRYIAGWTEYQEINRYAADVDKNGYVDIDDVLYISRYIAGWIEYQDLD